MSNGTVGRVLTDTHTDTDGTDFIPSTADQSWILKTQTPLSTLQLNCLSRYEALQTAHSQTSGRLLSETNRDMDQQKRLAEMEKKRRESMAVFSQTTKENQQQIEILSKQVCIDTHQKPCRCSVFPTF